MKPRKYLKGHTLTLYEALHAMGTGAYVMLHDKPMHPGWGMAMQARVLKAFCERGFITAANINPEWEKKQ